MQEILSMWPFLAVLVVFYLLVYVPDSRRRKKYNTMLSNLKVNDQVITRGGILGKILNIQDEYVTIQTGPDKTKIKISKNGISTLVNTPEEA